MTHINQRRDLASIWASDNPVLQEGEIGWETDTRRSKLGDGVSHWNDLLYTVSNPSVTKADVGLGSVDNTSDADKPISTAQATANASLQSQINAKAPLDSPALTGDPTAPTPATSDSDTSIATTAFVQSVATLARPKRWSSSVAYSVGDVVGYAGGIYRCTSAPTTGLPPALNTDAWGIAAPPQFDGWAQTDPYFASTSLTNTWQTFWKTGTVNSLAFTTTAGEFESGKRALKVDLAANSTQRLYPLTENLVKGGETIQIQVRAKLLIGTATATINADLQQNDQAGTPEPLATGVSSVAPMEGSQVLQSSWTTYTFTLVAANAKPRANATVIVGGGTSAATIAIDWIKTRRLPDVVGLTSSSRAPGVWHVVGAAGEPAFQNSWVSYDGGASFQNPQFRRDGNYVRLQGMTKAGSSPATIFTLPAGYRPLKQLVFPVISNNGLARVDVFPTGVVQLAAYGTGGSSTYVSLETVSFIAEQ